MWIPPLLFHHNFFNSDPTLPLTTFYECDATYKKPGKFLLSLLGARETENPILSLWTWSSTPRRRRASAAAVVLQRAVCLDNELLLSRAEKPIERAMEFDK